MEYSSASAPLWTRTTVADGHKFSTAIRLTGDDSTGRQTQFVQTPPAFGAPLGVISSEFRRDLLHHKAIESLVIKNLTAIERCRYTTL